MLPFFAPATRQVYSAAYVAGANNKLATVALALLSLAVLAGFAWRERNPSSPAIEDDAALSRTAALAGAILVALWTLGMGLAVARYGQRYGEADYFLERIRDVLQFHARIYRDLEFPYGPLLLLPPVWLVRALHLSAETAYLAWLTLVNVAGVLMAAYCLNRLPLGRLLRNTLFALCCLEQMHPLLGLNYSLGKFVLPFAVLLWAGEMGGPGFRGAFRQALAFAAGHLLTVLVSPELGVGLAGGIVAWAALAAYRRRSAWPLLSWLAPVAGYGIFLALFGRDFLDRLGNASAGALNLVIEPLPFVYIFLAALVWFAPRATGSRLRTDEGPLLLGLFVLSLGLLPGALGRADALHVYFNGWGLFTLSAVGMTGRKRTLVWAVLLVALGVEVQATNFKIYAGGLRALAHVAPPAEFDGNTLRQQTGGQSIALPALFQVPLADELELRRAGLNLLDYRAGLGDLWDAPAEQAKIARLRQSDWALVPSFSFVQQEGSPNASRLKRMLRFGYRYPERYEPYQVGALLEQELAANWVVVNRFQQTELLHRVR